MSSLGEVALAPAPAERARAPSAHRVVLLRLAAGAGPSKTARFFMPGASLNSLDFCKFRPQDSASAETDDPGPLLPVRPGSNWRAPGKPGPARFQQGSRFMLTMLPTP